jgi:Flp pilus assembly protein TadG
MTLHRRTDERRGQALVEFALVVPIFLLLIFAIVDVGRYVYTNNSLNQAAREAARVGSVTSRPVCTTTTRLDCINEVARARSTGFALKTGVASSGSPDDPGVYVTCQRVSATNTLNTVAVANCLGGDVLRVKVNHEFFLVTPLIAQFLGDLDLSGEAQVTVSS